MIRFACPVCAAAFAADDGQARQPGKCAKCGAAFEIPAATPTSVPLAAETVAIDPCPKCGTQLAVKPTDVGTDVECPYCQAQFRARTSAVPVIAPRPSRRAERDDEPARPRRLRDDDADADERPRRRSPGGEESKRIAAGILALLLGSLGVHKFYLGYTNAGLLMLLLTCCTGIGGIIAFVEGILYLVMSDEEFIQTYQVGRKEWF